MTARTTTSTSALRCCLLRLADIESAPPASSLSAAGADSQLVTRLMIIVEQVGARDQIEQQLQTNVVGAIQLTRAVLPRLRAQGGGKIVQLSTMGGQFAYPGMSLYHASKWAIEGFFDSVSQEVAGFGIQVCLVEPGGARTDFGGRSLTMAPALEAYADTAAGALRAHAKNRRPAEIPGDPRKMVGAMIDAVDADETPRRLLLGSDAYRMVHAALSDRLASVEAQHDLTTSTDADDYALTTA